MSWRMPSAAYSARTTRRLINEDLFVAQLGHVADAGTLRVRENFLTVSFAGALRESAPLRRGVLALLNGDSARWYGRPIGRLPVTVEQPHKGEQLSKGGVCFPDLVLNVGDEHRVGIEVKIGAPLGTDSAGRNQIDKYLALGSLTHVALLTGYHTDVPEAARKARSRGRYLVPSSGREHFLWSDVYRLVHTLAHQQRASVLVRALLGLLDHLRFRPFDDVVGDLGGLQRQDMVDAATRDRRAWMVERLQPLRATLVARGYKPEAVRVNGTLYVHVPGRAPWLLWVDPRQYPGMLRIAVRCFAPRANHNRDELLAAINDKLDLPRGAVALPLDAPSYPYAEVYLPYATLLRGATTVGAVERRLHKAVMEMIDLAESRLGEPSRRRPVSDRQGARR